MPRRRSIPALVLILAQLVLATAFIWHHHDHHDDQGGGADDSSCAICHAVMAAPQADVPTPTALTFDAPLVAVLELLPQENAAVLFVREACARGPPQA